MHFIQLTILIRLLIIPALFTSSLVNAADIDAGKDKAGHCMGCHGANGDSKNSQFPKLAGQKSSYLESQLKNFQSDRRSNSIMQGMAANLSKQDIKNLSAYFANETLTSAGGDSKLAKKGEAKVAMCKGCHGNDLGGRGATPRLAGQHPGYLISQLKNFKSKARKGGPMNALASSLSEDDMNEIAAYLGRL